MLPGTRALARAPAQPNPGLIAHRLPSYVRKPLQFERRIKHDPSDSRLWLRTALRLAYGKSWWVHVGADLGSSLRTIWRWVSGDRPMPEIAVKRLVRRLELTVERFDRDWDEARGKARAELANALQQGKIILSGK